MYSRILCCSRTAPKHQSSIRQSSHSKERWSRESSFKQTLSVLPTDFHLTKSHAILRKESPFNRLCFHQSPFYRRSTKRKPLLNKGSLAPLNGVTKPTKADYSSEKFRVFLLSKSYQGRTLSSPLIAVPTQLNLV